MPVGDVGPAPGRRPTARWPARCPRLWSAPTGCRPRSSRAAGRRRWPAGSAGRPGPAAATSRDGRRPALAGPRANTSAARRALSTVDSASRAGGRTARSTRPLCESSHRPSVNGATALSSSGMPTVADRTAASTQPDAATGATEANEASPQSGRADRQRAGSGRPGHVEADAPAVGVERAVPLPARRVGLHQQRRRRFEHECGERARPAQPGEVAAHQASQASRMPLKICRRTGWSQLRKLGPQDRRGHRPRAAAQHPVVAVEERRRVVA